MGQGIAHSILLLSIVIAFGILLGKIKVLGISLGITMVLFVGIILAHFGFTINHEINHFFKEFGLILFVYSVGLQVGPGFFSSFKKGGVTLNMLATGIVLIGVVLTLIIHYVPVTYVDDGRYSSGAVTNTPGLGAAQQAYSDVHGTVDDTIALGMPSLILRSCRHYLFHSGNSVYFPYIDGKKQQEIREENEHSNNGAKAVSLVVTNPAVFENQSVRSLIRWGMVLSWLPGYGDTVINVLK
jgi:putative transport protein